MLWIAAMMLALAIPGLLGTWYASHNAGSDAGARVALLACYRVTGILSAAAVLLAGIALFDLPQWIGMAESVAALAAAYWQLFVGMTRSEGADDAAIAAKLTADGKSATKAAMQAGPCTAYRPTGTVVGVSHKSDERQFMAGARRQVLVAALCIKGRKVFMARTITPRPRLFC